MPPPYAPVGVCIYCGARTYSKDPLAKRTVLGGEHLIPESLDGHLELPEASCQSCEATTNSFETFCANNLLHAFRFRLGIKGKRARSTKPQRPSVLFLRGREWGRPERVLINEYPVSMMIPVLPLPDLMRPVQIEKTNVMQFSSVRLWTDAHMTAFLKKYHANAVRFIGAKTNVKMFVRLLARVAHAFLTAEIGHSNFHPLLLPTIRGEAGYPSHHFIGCTALHVPTKHRHAMRQELRVFNGRAYWVVHLHLFGDIGFPRFACIAGMHKQETLPPGQHVTPLIGVPDKPWRLSNAELYAERNSPHMQIYAHPYATDADDLADFTIGYGPTPNWAEEAELL
jgi:hypothetical protein